MQSGLLNHLSINSYIKQPIQLNNNNLYLVIKYPIMFIKRFLLVIFLLTGISLSNMAQTKNDYAANWKKVEDFEKKGLTKSALTGSDGYL